MERLSAQPTSIARPKVKLADVPIDVLYNPEINKILGSRSCGVTNSFVPVHFKIENEAFSRGGTFEVEYSTYINDVEIQTTTEIKGLKEKNNHKDFVKMLQTSKPTNVTELQDGAAARAKSNMISIPNSRS